MIAVNKLGHLGKSTLFFLHYWNYWYSSKTWL